MIGEESVHLDQQEPHGVAAWLSSLVADTKTKLSRKTQYVIHTLANSPRRASYGTIREIAEMSNVSSATITRTAQLLGFGGWPALQDELRARYITSITLTEYKRQRSENTSDPASSSLRHDEQNLSTFNRIADTQQIHRVAVCIASSRRVFIVAAGSFIGTGYTLSHVVNLNGYDARLLTESYAVTNAIATGSPEDLFIVINFWRLHRTAKDTILSTTRRGVPVVLLTDNVPNDLDEMCTECVRIPTEGTGFSPSLTVATAVINGITAELFALDPGRSTRMAEQAEVEWEHFELQHRY